MVKVITDEFHYTLFKREGDDRKNAIYCFAYYDENGKRHKKSTGCTNEKKARAYVNKLIAEGKFKDPPQKDLTFKEFVEQNCFWDYDRCPIVKSVLARKGKYSRELCKSNGDCMRKHIFPTFENVKLKKITKAMINNWLIYLPDAANLSNKSVNNMRSILYQILQVASDMDLIKKEIVLDC